MKDSTMPSSSGSDLGERRRSSRIQAASVPWYEMGRSTRSTPQPGMRSSDEEPSRPKTNGNRLRLRKAPSPVPNSIADAMEPLTSQEQRDFRGWVELESDPAIFNFVLREYGVENVKIQEVLGLEDEMLTFLPKPVYGLIFLFKYGDDDADEAQDTAECPGDVWFANQTTNSACATVALLNIVMNVPAMDLGPAMKAFRDSTQPLKPALRGHKLSQHEFIRQKHNSFARRMDILNADLALSNDATAWRKRRLALRKNLNGSNPKRKKVKHDDYSSFHFIAYVPTNGNVWRLDGLQQQPVNLGPYGDDWIAIARANIYQRIGQNNEDGLQFNLLSLCKSPLRSVPEDLARNIKAATAIEAVLAVTLPEWKQFVEGNGSFHDEESDNSFGISKEVIDAALCPESTRRELIDVGTDATKLMNMHSEYLREQNRLKALYMDEISLINQENEQAARRKSDNTPTVYMAMKTLAEKGVLRDIVTAVRE